jgi:hypothetical protein
VSGTGSRAGTWSELLAADSSAAVRKPRTAEPTAITLTVTTLIDNTRYDETHASDRYYHSPRSYPDGRVTAGSTMSDP